MFIAELCVGSELGDLRQSEDEEGKPWERSRPSHRLDRPDFPGMVQITKANMLYMRKDGFSHQALNAIKRLAAFKNPEFYKAQAMRLPTGKKPRVISLSDETSVYLGLPRGCEADLADFFDDYKVKYELVDAAIQRMGGAALYRIRCTQHKQCVALN